MVVKHLTFVAPPNDAHMHGAGFAVLHWTLKLFL
jgi:hypothetical protein